jgi:hypothetical protein
MVSSHTSSALHGRDARVWMASRVWQVREKETRMRAHTPLLDSTRSRWSKAREGKEGERYASRNVTPNNLRRERKSQEGHTRVERDPQARGLVHVHCVTCCVKI